VKVADAVPEFADAFGFEEFNRMQREALPGILETEHNVVASAPTASGKTALAGDDVHGVAEILEPLPLALLLIGERAERRDEERSPAL